MSVKIVNGRARVCCDNCPNEYKPRPAVVDVTCTLEQRAELEGMLRLRASRQGWSSLKMGGADWFDVCPAHRISATGARVLVLFFTVMMSVAACGQVDQTGVGGAGGRDGVAGAAGMVGGASTAPACRGTFVGASQDRLCPEIAGTPQRPGGWQCEVNCSSSAADNAGGCIFNGVTYCVSSCSRCAP